MLCEAFLSVTSLDEVSNRVGGGEGVVYAPETDRRSYIRRIEASLYTLLLPGETAPGNKAGTGQNIKTND